jgi:hypothetical protein
MGGSGTHPSTDDLSAAGRRLLLPGPGVHRCEMDGQGPSGTTTSGREFDTRQVLSPGGWQVPSGRRPGWDWVPPAGARARLDRVPRWVRILFWTPFLDRYAHRWMWFHGGWDVDPPDGLDPGAAERLVWSTPPPRRRPPRRRFTGRLPGEPPRIVSFVIGLVDPAYRYMEQRHPGRRGPHRRGRRPRCIQDAAAGACTPGGERPTSLDEVWPTRERREQMLARHAAAVQAAEHRWGRQARTSAGELVRDGVTVLQLDNEQQVRGRVIRFWRGDSVLHLTDVDPDGERGGESKTRLSRGQDTDADLMAFYLLQQAAQRD